VWQCGIAVDHELTSTVMNRTFFFVESACTDAHRTARAATTAGDATIAATPLQNSLKLANILNQFSFFLNQSLDWATSY
jgi:hypothetical protein